MQDLRDGDRFDAIVIGGSQAGLAAGYHLRRHGLGFAILDAGARVGDAWRSRWDSLRLFTPARYDNLPGMPFPADPHTFPTKDEVADYLDAYARRFDLPVHTGVRVDRVRAMPGGSGFASPRATGCSRPTQVILATGAFHHPLVPSFAGDLDPGILQLHASEYRRPAQLRDGPVLVVGASNSGSEIALDIARAGGRRVWLAGRDTGHLPFDTEGRVGRWLDPLIWFGANHIMTVRTPIGRKARASIQLHGEAVERARPHLLAAAGVERLLGRVSGVSGGRPTLEDGDRPRRGQRGLVHRLPARLRLDRAVDHGRRRLARPGQRDRRRRRGPVHRGTAVPDGHRLRAARRGLARRGVRRGSRRRARGAGSLDAQASAIPAGTIG